jgi:hypothetical protein
VRGYRGARPGVLIDCLPRTGLLFLIGLDDLEETSFVVRTGGTGTAVADSLFFLQVNGDETIRFEGNVEAAAGIAR